MWAAERPSRVEEYIGNEGPRKIVISWFREWIRGTKPLLLIGPPGVGKTSLVHTLGIQYGLDIIELNASDTRNKNNLSKRIIPLFQNLSLLDKTFLLFLDEVDGLSGREDMGAIEFLSLILKESPVPTILAANETNQITKDLSKVCKVVSFLPIPPRLCMLHLNYILKLKSRDLSPGDKFSVVTHSSGDIRKLLNDAQSKTSGYSGVRDSRSRMDVENAINKFFTCTNPNAALDIILAANVVFSDPRFGQSAEDRRKDLINTIFSSVVSSRIDCEAIRVILNILSKVDVLLGKSTANRNWRVLGHLPYILAYSLFQHTRLKQIQYNRYSIGFQYMGNIFSRGQSLRSSLAHVSKNFHTSRSNFGLFVFPFMTHILACTPTFKDYIINSLSDQKAAENLINEVTRTKKLINQS
ncbi:MAG: AAA family ATPase [Thermoproteota archaeon]|nr:AAA family ATPase [Thermoproteota archaeon]